MGAFCQVNSSGTIRGLLASGYSGGTWSGVGITSSIAAADRHFAVGYADGSADIGTKAAAGEVLVEYTLAGDTNLDGTVNLTDLLNLLNNYEQSGRDWSEGDFNYDGTVNITDLLIMLSDYGATVPTGAAVLAAQGTFSQAGAIPEPVGGGLVILAIAALATRMRKP
jgi:hypothetical protein